MPENCLELKHIPGEEHICNKCKPGFFLYESLNECWPCDDIENGGVDKCSICSSFEVIDDTPVVQCD